VIFPLCSTSHFPSACGYLLGVSLISPMTGEVQKCTLFPLFPSEYLARNRWPINTCRLDALMKGKRSHYQHALSFSAHPYKVAYEHPWSHYNQLFVQSVGYHYLWEKWFSVNKIATEKWAAISHENTAHNLLLMNSQMVGFMSKLSKPNALSKWPACASFNQYS
jgi:hypothetical protein